ncbi:rhomboid family intramembrane serine protease [Fibrella forsythiae]|uniref:Rhomboid family intramembrane serine protease n=1 Tax=Fibrella forsythiae TaxID=2817061 RepID=A0ABS3JFG3_9BACT|nr:rhomboid family intramembrane serine protease [Fibrella forsythiae]MBO0948744.1 rhomboid family intramembrane serine protease [Fibrella forsythiae]
MSITLLLIAVTVGISLWAWNNPALMDRWIMNPYAVARRGEYHRLITSGFLHADMSHLFLNMLSFYFFGQGIERIFGELFGELGGAVLVGFYLIAIVISDIPTLIKYKDSPGYNSLGASGGVSAIIFATILIFPLTPIYFFFIPVPIPGFIFALLYLAYSYYAARRGNTGVNHDAHLYGGLFGIVFMAIAYPPAIPGFVEQVIHWRPF